MATQFLFAASTLLLHLFHMPIFAIASVHDINTDQTSLLAFKDRISDPNPILFTNWSSASPVCNWIGITCGSSHHRVTGLNLSHMDLVGTLPPHLGNLSFLAVLDLSNNSFNGSIPDELAQLRRLKQIVLNFNDFSGEIPSWFLLLPKLQKLDLGSNKFGGSLPLNVFNSSSLQHMDFTYNLISGSIPSIILRNSSLQFILLSVNKLAGELPNDIFYHLPYLNDLLLTYNQLSGNIPLTLFSCKKLEKLSLGANRLEGFIPRAIGNLTMLKAIDLGDNNFEPGTLPNEIGYLRNLEVMLFHNVPLTGNIPSSIFNISTLKKIDLSDNQLLGNLPSSLGFRLPNLEELYLWGNFLTGKIPNSLGNVTKLRLLDLKDNSFSGYIPDIFENLRNLEGLYLGDINVTTEPANPGWSFLNSLTNCRYLRRLNIDNVPLSSTLPISMGNLSTSLEELAFENCKIEGSIPKNIGNMSGLITMSLTRNQLSGSIPIGIQKLKKLQGLFLDYNNLEGLIPHELCQLQHWDVLSLSFNMFFGPIPTCLGNITTLAKLYLQNNNFDLKIPSTLWDLSNLLYIDLSSNKLKGSLTSKMSNLKVVIYVNLSKNKLSGGIPSSIGELQNLQELFLNENNLEGPIPQSFGHMISLEYLDLSKNILSGVIPKSLEALVYLKYFNVSFNELEGEIPMGGPFGNFSIKSFMGNKELCGAPQLYLPKCKSSMSKQSFKAIAIVLKYTLPLIVVIGLVLVIIYVLLKCQKTKKPSIIEVEATIATWRRISYYEIQRATDGFADSNLLGMGSFGKVYKGILSDGLIVAVKVFNLDQEGTFRSFDVECEVLCNVRHRNLTEIISSCSNFDFKALVLRYMSNGSLEKWLHSHDHCLSITQRLCIMIDVATALDYLHHGGPVPIIHCDLKPHNVLLDEDMVAHVTDFGISKILGEGHSITQTMTFATMGYMAPEYGLEGIVSKQGDVYSYGVLLIETFTGKNPTCDMFKGELSIKQWVKESYLDLIMDIIDPKLSIDIESHIAIKRDCLVSIMGLALDCLMDLPSERRSIKDALVTLEKIKIKFMNEVRDSRLSIQVC